MHSFTLTFLTALVFSTGLRLWLSWRQSAAVRRHRERVPAAFDGQISPEDHQKAADYTLAGGRLGRLDTVLDAVVVLILTVGGGLAWIDRQWSALGWSALWQGVAVILSVMLLVSLIELPMTLVRTFGIEARFGFNRTTPALFVADLLKGWLLGALLGVPLLLVVLYLMEHAGTAWWLYAWAVFVGFSLCITWAFPRFIAPLFNKFTVLSDEALRARVDALLERCGFASKGIFVMDGSRRSAHGNAYFTGIGRSKRIVFFDTLIERLAPPEVEAVLAHELGHFSLHHVRQRLVVSFGFSLLGLALLGVLARWPDFYSAFGFDHAAPYIALLLFMFVLPPFSFFATPIGAWWSRRHEFQADVFAAQHADARELVVALTKLYRDNGSTLTPDPVHSAFYDSHPPAVVRIARLQQIIPA